MINNFPKIEFSIAQFDEAFKVIHSFLNPSKNYWDWSDYIYTSYPELKRKIKNIPKEKMRRGIEYAFFREHFEREKSILEKKRKVFQNEWDKINNRSMITLSKIVEQDWPKKDILIQARLSLNPICPRYIKTRTFDIFYRKSTEDMKGIAIHELLHFIYFEKWKKVFPKTKPREFDSPYLVWHLSEMVPKILLNDERIQRIHKYKFNSYRVYEQAKIEEKPLLSYLQSFYNERTDFKDFLKESWLFVQRHKSEIKKL